MKKTLLPLLAAALLAACAPITVTPDKYKNVVRADDEKVYVQRIVEAVTPDNILKVTVFAASNTAFDQTVRWRAKWFDENGQPIDTPLSSWREMRVTGKTQFEFTAVAPGSRAVKYVFDVETK